MSNEILTRFKQATILKLSCSSKIRPSTPFSIGVKAPFHGVFYCPKKIITDFIRHFVMVARNGQSQDWPVPIPGSANPLRVAAQQLALVGGGYQSSVLELPQ